jgi:DMSO/TMAO reductase YedYZ molybdopterin-dependent catalytic subunit
MNERDAMEIAAASRLSLPGDRRMGRGVFLGLTAATAGALFLGRHLPSPDELLPGQTVNGFVIYTVGGIPTINAETWNLRIGGAVEFPKSYTYRELRAMPVVRETRYYQCVNGWVVKPEPLWIGVRLWDIIRAAKPKPGAQTVVFNCIGNSHEDTAATGWGTPYSETLTMEQAQRSDVILAYGLNGRLLAKEQGYPLRLVVPGMYGYKYAKWLGSIDVTSSEQEGYWEAYGYDVNAWIGKSNAKPPRQKPGEVE